ncbi:ionotropic receptor 75a-like [Macrosteles quadrilineatus]|uniref:ionotropic receptor 75a-like n=1 Tax=Macrosteles quadrilineatus TaxID=74068 RepID=UPI0023E2BD24|nr:ionotropic receptor 75a-like [Macrosteles quadrilineatus]
MNAGHFVSVMNIEDQKTEEFNNSMRLDYGSLGVVVEMNCENANTLLTWASRNKLFTTNYHWLVVDESNKTIEEILLNHGVELNLESEVMWINQSEPLRVYEVYQTGTLPHGQLVVSEMPNGTWTSRKWKLDSRVDLRGLVLNVTEVVKPNSVAGLGTAQASDASELQDYDDIFSYLTDDRFPHLDSMSKFSWAVFEIQQNLFNFSARLVPTASWGYVFNGQFDGMVRLLMNGSADVGATTLAIRPPRLAVVDYTMQIWPYQPLFILRHPRQGTLRDTFLKPLSPGVWLCSCLVVLLIFCLMRFIDWMMRVNQSSGDRLSWSGSLIILIGAVSQQGSALVPRQVSSRLLFFFLFAWSTILYQFYTSSIVSSLLSPPRRYINTLQDLAHSPFIIGFEKVLTSKDTLTRYSAILPVVREIYEKQVIPRGDAAYYTPAQGIRCMQEGNFAFYVDPASAYRLIEEMLSESEICDLVEIALNPKEVLALPLQKGSPYRKLLIYGQRKMMEAGIIKREVRRWQSRRPICTTTDHHSKSIPETAQVGMAEISPALLLLLLGLMVSLILLFYERSYFRYCIKANLSKQPLQLE